jgi:hypothetical protein
MINGRDHKSMGRAAIPGKPKEASRPGKKLIEAGDEQSLSAQRLTFGSVSKSFATIS